MSEAIDETTATTETADSPSTLSSAPADAWYRDLPAEYHGEDYLRKHDSVESFVKEAIHAKTLIGRKGVIPPNDDSDIADWSRFYGELGRPEGIESYSTEEWDVENESSSFPRNEEYEKTLLKEIYDLGLNESQAQKLWSFYLKSGDEQYGQQMESFNALSQDLDTKLSDKYGQDRDVKLEGGRRAWTELGEKIGATTEEWLGFLEQPMANGQRLGDQWPLIQAFVALGDMSSESSIKGGKNDSHAATRISTPSGAQEEVNRLLGDSEFLSNWTDRSKPGHDNAVAEMNRLNEILHGD